MKERVFEAVVRVTVRNDDLDNDTHFQIADLKDALDEPDNDTRFQIADLKDALDKPDKEMRFLLTDLKDALKDCVTIDLDIENGTASLGRDGEYPIESVVIDWDHLREVRA